MTPKNTQNQSEIQSVLDLGQTNIQRKISVYLEKQNRDKAFIAEFTKGYCAGLSTLWLYAKWLQTQPNPENKPRDDYSWFKKTEELFSSWDGKRDLTKEETEDFDRFISHIERFQNIQQYLPVLYGELDKIIEDTKSRKLKKEYSIAALFTLDQLKKLLRTDNFIQEEKLVLISSHDHAMALFKSGDSLYYLDPNDPRGETKTSSTDDIASCIFYSNNLLPFLASPIGFRIFTFDEKLGHYPKQSDLLQKVWITSDIPDSDKYANGCTGLIIATRINSVESAKFLLGLKTNSRNFQDYKHRRTALMLAATNGSTELVKLLLEKDADPNIQDDSDITALMFAIEKRHLEIVKELLKKGANPNIVSANGQSALTLAINYRHIEIIKELLADPKTDINSIITPNIIKSIPNSIKKEFFQELLKYKSRLNLESLFLIRKLVPGFKTAATNAMSSCISPILTKCKGSQ